MSRSIRDILDELDKFEFEAPKDIKSLTDAIKSNYPDANKFKKIVISKNSYLMDLITTSFADKLTNVVYRAYDDEELGIIHFDLINENFCVFGRHILGDSPSITIIFTDDIEKLLNQIKNKEVKIIKPGVYNLIKGSFGWGYSPVNLKEEQTPILEDGLEESIQKDIDVFFTKEQFYKDNKLPFKRGILLFGPPGNGKSSMIKNVLKKHHDKYCIIINCSEAFDRTVNSFIKMSIKESKKIIIFEDIDELEKYNRSSLLNFLDGIDTLENTLVIATTNNLHKVDPALVDRPSRFDRIYNIDFPNEASREILLKRFFPTIDKTVLEQAIKDTKGFSGAYFKELYIYSNLQECDVLTAIKNVTTVVKLYKKNNKNNQDYMG